MEISSTTGSFGSIVQLAELRREKELSRKTEVSPSESTEDAKTIEKLRARDREVRAHEQAHAAAAGGLATGGPTFTFQRGPDGKQYAVGGEVNIDTSPVAGNPEATLRKAQQIRSAALAPADPSSQDRAVAASTAALAAQARQEIQEQKKEEEEDQEVNESTTRPDRPKIDLFV